MNHESLWEWPDRADQEAWDEQNEARREHDAAVAARDRAIEKADRGASPLWVEEALTAVKALARVEPVLTSEDVADQLELSTPEPRALGAIMLTAQANGWIAPTERWTPARHAKAHKRPMREWRSLLFVGEAAA